VEVTSVNGAKHSAFYPRRVRSAGDRRRFTICDMERSGDHRFEEDLRRSAGLSPYHGRKGKGSVTHTMCAKPRHADGEVIGDARGSASSSSPVSSNSRRSARSVPDTRRGCWRTTPSTETHRRLTLVAPESPPRLRPGQFVALRQSNTRGTSPGRRPSRGRTVQPAAIRRDPERLSSGRRGTR